MSTVIVIEFASGRKFTTKTVPLEAMVKLVNRWMSAHPEDAPSYGFPVLREQEMSENEYQNIAATNESCTFFS